MSGFTARKVQETEKTAWQALWERSGARLAQHWCWADWAATGTGEPLRIGLFDRGGGLLAGISFIVRSRRGIRCLRHPAPLSYSGLMAPEENLSSESFRRDAFRAVSQEAVKMASFADIITQPGLEDVRGLLWEGWRARPHFNYVSFIETEGDLERQAENSVRRQAAKARKAGFSLETGGEDLLDEVIDLWSETRARQGVEAYLDDEVFRSAVRGASTMADEGLYARAMVVREPEAGRVMSGGIFLGDRDRVYYLLGGTSEKRGALGSGAPSLLQFLATEQIFRERGVFTYDWVGANTQSVAQFKKKFRPRLELCLRAVMAKGMGKLLRP